MQAKQKVCRHEVVNGSTRGDWHIGQQRLSSTCVIYVRLRRSKEWEEGRIAAASGELMVKGDESCEGRLGGSCWSCISRELPINGELAELSATEMNSGLRKLTRFGNQVY